MQSEAAIQRAFIRAVKKAGGWPIKLKGPRGWPDYLVLWKESWAEMVELKRPGGRLRYSQERMHDKLNEHGMATFTISTREEIAAYVEGER